MVILLKTMLLPALTREPDILYWACEFDELFLEPLEEGAKDDGA